MSDPLVPLVVQLRAALAEDERVAREAARHDGPSWVTSDMGAWLSSEHGHTMIGEEYGPGQRALDHIARHDPQRVLRDVRAHREIVDRYEKAFANAKAHPDDFASKGALLALHGVVTTLAEAYGIEDTSHQPADPRVDAVTQAVMRELGRQISDYQHGEGT